MNLLFGGGGGINLGWKGFVVDIGWLFRFDIEILFLILFVCNLFCVFCIGMGRIMFWLWIGGWIGLFFIIGCMIVFIFGIGLGILLVFVVVLRFFVRFWILLIKLFCVGVGVVGCFIIFKFCFVCGFIVEFNGRFICCICMFKNIFYLIFY